MGKLAFFIALCSLARVCVAQFVVETNSMRIREPEALVGEFDVAIGDVSAPAQYADDCIQLVLRHPAS